MVAAKGDKPTLNDLIAKGDELDDTELAEALSGRIRLLAEVQKVQFQGDLKAASGPRKLVAAGLGRHVMTRTGHLTQDALPASTEWFAEQVQQKPKTMGEQLSRLKKAGLMDRAGAGWYVPTWALAQAIQFVTDGTK